MPLKITEIAWTNPVSILTQNYLSLNLHYWYPRFSHMLGFLYIIVPC